MIFYLREQNTCLNNKATVFAVSGFTLNTSTNGQCIQWIKKYQIVMLLPISGNYHLPRLSGLIWKFAIFYVTGCLFPLKSRKSGPHCSCMNLLFLQQVNSYPFCSALNEYYKERTLWACYLNWNIFIYFYNSFLGETPETPENNSCCSYIWPWHNISLKLCNSNVF